MAVAFASFAIICSFATGNAIQSFTVSDQIYSEVADAVTENYFDSNNNGIYDYETYEDLNKNGIYDESEPFEDVNKNNILDQEIFEDENENGIYDSYKNHFLTEKHVIFSGFNLSVLQVINGLILAGIVGMVIIGGIRRIGHVTGFLAPFMAIIYVIATGLILIYNFDKLSESVGMIFTMAFNPPAAVAGTSGGILLTMLWGIKRGLYSNEAGQGSAAIAHSTAKTKYPIREGAVAMLGPFIDTIIICTMTALVIVITGVYDANGEFANLVASKNGAALTSAAFGTVLSWFPVILTISVALFAFSTMISWSYYGERAWTYVFGERYTLVYRLLFIGFTVVASIVSLGNMLNFSDLLILGMAFPNLLGVYILHGKVKEALSEYIAKLKSGELDREVIKE
ncbi:MAG: hypothetical protein DSY99_00235 [Candidatus Neomarinimicrobiota bacterium]|nr:MAG: hypothetical protein DSY99_00235 [Candidatus Neomarinimicrobiota bacterium]